MDYREKFDKVLAANGLKIYEVEKMLGFSAGTIQKAYNENRDLSKRLSKEFLKMFHVKHDWWATGQGEIFNESRSTVTEEPEANYGNKENLITYLKRLVDLLEEKENRLENEVLALKQKITGLEHELEECRKKNLREKV